MSLAGLSKPVEGEVKGDPKGRPQDRGEGQSDWPKHRPLTE